MRNESLISMGLRIKTIRKEMSVKQEEMAAALGISTGYMSEIERGKANPTADLLLKLVEKYHINIAYLFHGNGEKRFPGKPDIHKPEFSLDKAVNSKEHLNWLLDISVFLRNTIMAHASKIVFKNKDLIKDEIQRTKNKE